MTDVPDYISPILSYRVWQWDTAGLRLLNGEFWRPGKPLEARCRVCDFAKWRGRHHATRGPHHAPHMACTCGIYAHKHLEHFRERGYDRSRILGQASLWGTVIEHEQGWRAQFAYPHSFFLTPDTLPLTFTEIQGRLWPLISYRRDILIMIHEGISFPLWTESLGFDAAGIDFLSSRGRGWYATHRERNAIKQGDRLAVIGWGTAVVDEIGSTYIRAMLGDKSVVRIDRKRIYWNQPNVRWETRNHLVMTSPERLSLGAMGMGE